MVGRGRLVVFRLKMPVDLLEALEDLSGRTGLSKGEIVRRALKLYLEGGGDCFLKAYEACLERVRGPVRTGRMRVW